MRLLVIIKNTPSSSINKRRRSSGKRSSSSLGRRSRRSQQKSRRVVFVSPRASASASAAAARKMSSPVPESMPEWLRASLARTPSPLVSVPAAPHNTTDFLMRLHADRSCTTSSSSITDTPATDTLETAMGTGTPSNLSSSSSLSCDSFDGLDTFGSNFGLINANFFQSLNDSFHQDPSPALLPTSASPGFYHTQLNNAVEAR